jgi:peptide/nickel transport system permease protein
VFSSIPYLLLILAVAAVLQQKGIADDHPDPRPHRLDRRVPADPRRVPEAQGARVRAGGRRDRRVERARMFVHIFPNVRHVVLVQLSILAVASSRPR